MRTATSLSTVLLGVTLIAPLSAADNLTAEQIAERAEQADRSGTNSLVRYTVTRHYVIENPRFNKHAEMTVRVSYKAGEGKTFQIVSSQGADGMQKKVFEKLIEAEKESSQQEMVEAMRIGSHNYAFQLLGTEVKNGQKSYKLAAKPKRRNKFLLEGTVWISADDFGIVGVEGRPSERVSFWVGKPQITQTFCKVGPVWMMSGNRSVAEVKLVGHSELMIESFDYKVQYQHNDQVAHAFARGSRTGGVTE